MKWLGASVSTMRMVVGLVRALASMAWRSSIRSVAGIRKVPCDGKSGGGGGEAEGMRAILGAKNSILVAVTESGQVVFGGIEQFAQQLAFARIHLAKEGLTIGRLGGAVDQTNQPGPHAMADRLQQCGYQRMQFALG